LPELLQPLLAALNHIPALNGMVFDQLTINDYFAGDGIPAHFDTHSPFEQPFLSVSLLSGLVMDFRKYDGEERAVYLPPRSVAIFSGEVRFAWTHGITCRKVDSIDGELRHRSRRLSLTFRKIKFTPCNCPYYFYCDSQGYDQQTMKKNNPLLAKYLSQQNAQKLSALSPK
jgi:alkylated DNA repair protein alkB family protein 8